MFEVVAGYKLIRRLGEGGMGSVYLAETPEGSSVAIKLIRPELLEREEFRARFRSEVARAQTVPPFCTAEVIVADPDHDPPYLVIEYVDGPSLFQVVRDSGPLQGAKLHTLAVGVATALSAIHGAGVVHRDLKPGNVLYSRGSIKVIDFGIARDVETQTNLTTANQVVGTLAYVSPERLGGAKTLTPAADVFAWGVLMAFAATGRTPFNGDTPADTAISILSDPPDLAGLSGSLLDLVEQALTKDPTGRPTARELLDGLLTTGPVTPRPAVPSTSDASTQITPPKTPTTLDKGTTLDVPRQPKPSRLRRALVLTSVFVLLIAVGLGGAAAAGLLDGVIPFGAQAGSTPTPSVGAPSPSPAVSSETSPSVAATVGPTVGPTPTIPPGLRLMYRSPLTKEAGVWQDTNLAGKADCDYGSKGLKVLLEANWAVFRCQGPLDQATDFVAEVDVKTTGDACATIWFRFQTKGNGPGGIDQPDGGYALQLCRDVAVLVVHDNSGVRTLRTMELHKSVEGRKARIKIVAKGHTFTFFQDGKQFDEADDDLYRIGRVVLGMLQRPGDPPAVRTVTFTNFVVHGTSLLGTPSS